MTVILVGGFLMGLLGSLHCVGMCGPLALSLPVVNQSHISRFSGALLYNIGRVFTYSILGLLFGLIGYSFILTGFQQLLSIGLGILILLIITLPKLSGSLNLWPKFFNPVRRAIGKLFQQPGYGSLFLIGLLNGLLPCGLVYMAVAGAVATASPVHSSIFMAAFGFGTLPLMWAVAFFGSSIKLNLRLSIKRAYPYMMFVMACLLILRGMELGIPFISPEFQGRHGMVESMDCHD